MTSALQAKSFVKNEITLAQMQLEASQGRYYHNKQWQRLSSFELFLRRLLFCTASTESAALHRSWQAIEQMPYLPQDIQKRLPELFKTSLYSSNPTSAHSSILCRLYCKSLQNSSSPTTSIHIEQHQKQRSFNVSLNQRPYLLVANSEYGRFDFYNPQKVKIAANDYDSLCKDGKQIAAIKLACNYPRQNSCMKLFSADDRTIAKIQENKEKKSLIFREAQTNRLLAICNLIEGKSLEWEATLVDQKALNNKQLTPLIIAWAILKYSQHYHFPSSDDMPYITDPS